MGGGGELLIRSQCLAGAPWQAKASASEILMLEAEPIYKRLECMNSKQ